MRLHLGYIFRIPPPISKIVLSTSLGFVDMSGLELPYARRGARSARRITLRGQFSLWPSRWSHSDAMNARTLRLAGLVKVVLHLHACPEFRTRAKRACQAKSHIR